MQVEKANVGQVSLLSKSGECILLHRLKKFFLNSHIKINSGIALLAFLPFLAVALDPSVTTGTVVNGVVTRINAFCDGKKFSFETKSNNVADALSESQCQLSGNDISLPDADSFFSGGSVDINVTREKSVNIVDEGKFSVAKSAYDTPVLILKQIGIKTYPEDIVDRDLTLDNFLQYVAGQIIVIHRAPVFNVVVDGQTQEIRSWKKTIGEVIEDKKIPLGLKDEIFPARESVAVAGETITITRINVVESEENEAIAFKTISKKDYNLLQGKSSVEQEGINGLKKNTLRLVYKNGVLDSKTLISTVVLSVPQDKIVTIGVKPYSHQDLWAIMVAAGGKYGVDPSDMFKVMLCESGGNVMSGAGSKYQGLFQWDGTFHKWSSIAGYSANYFDPYAQIYATAARVSAAGGWSAWGCKP